MRKAIQESAGPASATLDTAYGDEAAVDTSDEKRKHPRFDVRNGALVNVLGSREAVVEANILDLSQSGLKLLMTTGFPVGEIIRAEVGDEVFVVVVCYCKESEEGFVVGTEMMHSIKRLHLDQLVDEWGVR